jgi:N-formylglutamate amidohydrolase
MTPAEYHLHLPDTISCGAVFSSPHSGRDYPSSFLKDSLLDAVTIRSSEDAFVDQLFMSAIDNGAPLLAASAPRAFVDLNRNADELDPAVVDGVHLVGSNPRISSGLGVIPRVVSEGRAVMQGKISVDDAKDRLDRFYHPYHAQLRELMDTSRAAFGKVLLIDCHSMPREALTNVSGRFGRMPEIVLGDRFGSSCEGAFVDEIEAALDDAGFRVARNTPFAGAHITQAYGRPSLGQSCLQIEVDRSLYLDEKNVVKTEQFDEIRLRLAGVVATICELTRWPTQLAAE